MKCKINTGNHDFKKYQAQWKSTDDNEQIEEVKQRHGAMHRQMVGDVER